MSSYSVVVRRRRQPAVPWVAFAFHRGFSEASLAKLGAEERKATVLAALRAFHAFQFWPEATGGSQQRSGMHVTCGSWGA